MKLEYTVHQGTTAVTESEDYLWISGVVDDAPFTYSVVRQGAYIDIGTDLLSPWTASALIESDPDDDPEAWHAENIRTLRGLLMAWKNAQTPSE